MKIRNIRVASIRRSTRQRYRKYIDGGRGRYGHIRKLISPYCGVKSERKNILNGMFYMKSINGIDRNCVRSIRKIRGSRFRLLMELIGNTVKCKSHG